MDKDSRYYLSKFTDLGFRFNRYQIKVHSNQMEYIYRPNYLGGNYYSLVLDTVNVTGIIINYTRFRLAILDKEGSYIEYFYDLRYSGSSRKYMDDLFEEIFRRELREQTLNRILK